MKKILFFAAVAASVLSFASCNKDNGNVVSGESGRCVMTLGLSGGGTKASDAEEAKVNSIQVFVFNGDAVDAYKAATAEEITAMQVVVDATVGTRDIYAFVNAPVLSSYTTKTALLAAESKLSDNSADSFVMGGKLENQTLAATYSGTVNVDRYAARVKISKITRSFTSAALQAVKFQITKLYLTSVTSNELYSFGQPDAYSWLNASFGDDRALSVANAFVYNKPAAAVEVADGASHEQEYRFYGYANVNASDDTAASDSTKTFKKTRLVVETQIDVNNNGTFEDDEYYTYPISLGAVESNKSYEITELIITRLGNHSDGDDDADDGEDGDIESGSITITIHVNDWTSVLVGNNGVVTI